jgi:alcohol dehydrogenase (cytochrome c)
MRCAIKETLLSVSLLCAFGLAAYAQAPAPAPVPTMTPRTVPNFVTITDQTMRAPKPEDWMMYRANYQAWGYSSLDQINKTNVKGLQLIWARAMEPGINEATPIIYNGVMYLGIPAT